MGPLNKEQILSPGTTIDLNQYAGSEQDESVITSRKKTTNTGQNDSASPLSWKDEFCQLFLPFEMLVIAAMVAILRNCLHTVLNSQATWLQYAVIVCVAIILVALCAFLVKESPACCEQNNASGNIKTVISITS